MKSRSPPRARIGRVLLATVALTCGAIIGVATYWIIGAGQPARSQVKATILEASERAPMRPAIGQWTTPDDTKRAGVIPAPPEHPAGAEYAVWIDETGHIANPPKSEITRIAQASLAGTCAAAGLISLVGWHRPGKPGSEVPARGKTSSQ